VPILLLSALAPEALGVGLVGGQDPLVVGSGPEPSVDVDGLQVGGVAALALEVALAAGRVDGAHVVCKSNDRPGVNVAITFLAIFTYFRREKTGNFSSKSNVMLIAVNEKQYFKSKFSIFNSFFANVFLKSDH
jgi:hypothetical protein